MCGFGEGRTGGWRHHIGHRRALVWRLFRRHEDGNREQQAGAFTASFFFFFFHRVSPRISQLELAHGGVADVLAQTPLVYLSASVAQPSFVCVQDSDVRSKHGLGREHLVAFAVMCGSDYCDGVPGIGPITATRALRAIPYDRSPIAAYVRPRRL